MSPLPPDDFLADLPLGGDFYRAAGPREVPDFEFGYIVAYRGKIPEAVVPYFVTKFKFNTMLDEGWLKSLMGDLGLRVACIGHPCAPFGHIDGRVSSELMEGVFEKLKTLAPVVAAKGFGSDLPMPGFVRVTGLPVAVLRLRENFWDTLASYRRNFRRKKKAAAALRFEEVDGLPEQYLARVYRLYLNTYNKASVRFERLSADYFAATAHLSRYLLVYLGNQMVGFVQMIGKGRSVLAFYMGLDYTVDRKHGVYFAMVMKAIDVAIGRGYTEVELGETNYSFKRSLGSELIDTWVYYRHRNPIANALLARLAFLLEPSETELR